MRRFASLADVFQLDDFLSGWFLGAPAHAVQRDNVEEFILYGMYAKRRDQTTAGERAEVHAFLEEVQARWRWRFPPGHNPALRFMAHTWEPLRVHHKPLVRDASRPSARPLPACLEPAGSPGSNLFSLCYGIPPAAAAARPSGCETIRGARAPRGLPTWIVLIIN
jgi:hypothetical protein